MEEKETKTQKSTYAYAKAIYESTDLSDSIINYFICPYIGETYEEEIEKNRKRVASQLKQAFAYYGVHYSGNAKRLLDRVKYTNKWIPVLYDLSTNL